MTAEKIGTGRYLIGSESKDDAVYSVDLVANTCNCKHWTYRCSENGTDCKHIKRARQEAWATSARIAQTLTNDDLNRLLVRYQAQDSLIVAGAIRWERARRKQEARLDAELKLLFA